jgi:FAD/FMN-containing dehydrogenase
VGVITRLVLRLREQPRSNSTALIAADSFEQIVALLRHTDAALGGLLSAFELIDNRFYNLNTCNGRHSAPLRRDYPFYAIIEALGSDQQRDTALFESALAAASELGLYAEAVIAASERQRADIWAVREDLQHVVRDFQPFYAFDVSLPVGEMAAYMLRVKQRLLAHWPEGAIAFLGHVGDGNLHIAIGAGTAQDREAVENCVYEPLLPFAGSISAEHGIGLEKRAYLGISRSQNEIELMLGLKDLLDPVGILNPGKIFGARTARSSRAA